MKDEGLEEFHGTLANNVLVAEKLGTIFIMFMAISVNSTRIINPSSPQGKTIKIMRYK